MVQKSSIKGLELRSLEPKSRVWKSSTKSNSLVQKPGAQVNCPEVQHQSPEPRFLARGQNKRQWHAISPKTQGKNRNYIFFPSYGICVVNEGNEKTKEEKESLLFVA